MKRIVVPVVALVISVSIVFGVSAQQNNIPPPNPNCAPLGHDHLNGQRVPTTIEPEFSIWCYQQPSPIPPTRSNGANDWVDTFDNSAPSILQFNDHDMGYRVFDVLYGSPNSFATGYFVNVNHWMIDLADVSTNRLSGGVLISPDRQFSFENGKLVVEVDAAAGSDGMGGANRFYEIDLTPAAVPSTVVDSLYGYGAFGGTGALGCRLERNDSGGNFVCAMYDNSNRVTGGECPNDGRTCSDNGGRPGRVWETQGVGSPRTARSVQGGYAQYPIAGTNMRLRDVWRQCATNELDLHCRDRFRMEITKDSIHLFVNGFPAMQIDGLFAQNPATGADNRIPDFWFQRGVRPYFTSWINGGQHTPTRWHWDRIAVNPHDGSGNFAAPSAAPSFCLGQPNNTCPDPGLGGGSPPTNTPLPSATSTPTPTPTSRTSPPTATPTATPITPPTGGGGSGSQTLTFDDLQNPNRGLNGEYPTGVADWGSNAWYLSGPFGAFRTNSISFDSDGPTSAPVRFPSARRLVSVDVLNGGDSTSTVTLSCANQPTVQRAVAPNQVTNIQTGWTGTCSNLTIGSTNGWQTNFDNLVVDSGGNNNNQSQNVNFDDQSNPNRPLNGQYPKGVIDWGSNGWYLSGPYGTFTGNSVSFNGSSITSQSFGLVTPRKLVRVEAYNGGTSSNVVTLSCPGQPKASFTLAARTQATLTTNWSGTCTSVTITSDNGWRTNFDNFGLQ
jgi:hypothetical protein